ncbi:MAG: ATP-binding protein, partial [Candidatus Nanoarchaeia archaeon]
MNKNIILLFFLAISCSCTFISALESYSAYGPAIEKEYYAISRSYVERSISKGNLFEDTIKITNLRDSKLRITLSREESLASVIDIIDSDAEIGPRNFSELKFVISGKGIGDYGGFLVLEGDVKEKIGVNISVVDYSKNPLFLVDVKGLKDSAVIGRELKFKIDFSKLKPGELVDVTFNYSIKDNLNNSFYLGQDNRTINTSFQDLVVFDFPEGLGEGNYYIELITKYEDKEITSRSLIILKKPFLKIMVFGFIPMWLLLLLLSLLLSGLISFYLIKRNIEKKKKYKMKLDVKKLPKKDASFFHLGKIAETNIQSYIEPLRLTTHTIVAGATGGGKSISAQVIVEEALLHNIAVIVFDPTAQWSGMLRKCTDKKMMSFYPQFGLKESDARGFPGNIRRVSNARQLINLKKYIHPGQIQIFACNKLDPSEIDIFVANMIRQVFRSDPEESPDLKILFVFDEVHRLLSKFGGSGEGFLQIERACREFRKWGIGIMLVSQVLSDFVGEVKANINTEIQMRTRDEGDLNRIKTKYGEEFLQSLVKASVGAGMFVNAAYNNALPYFIQFRPILHNTRRLGDDELDKYNTYNDAVDDLEDQIDQLEAEKVDVFDLKMELKLVKDKIMTGNFAIVDIYLEGLKPRVEKQWEKLGKKPKKRELQLVDEAEIKKSIEEAKKARDKFVEEQKKGEAKEEKKEEKKENMEIKIVRSLTFDNGIMVSSLKELKE